MEPFTPSDEQLLAFNKFCAGENLFITGPGGTGKSALIKHMQRWATDRDFNIHVCALTGCAAVLLNCNAKTLHSWSGIGLGNGEASDLVQRVMKHQSALATWRTTDILIIDEVSMLSKKLLNILIYIARATRRGRALLPFAGIQVIMLGDFYQLPPVGKNDDPDSKCFCFESEHWSQLFPPQQVIQLTRIFRQDNLDYQTILNQIRTGRLKSRNAKILQGLVGKLADENAFIKPTKLYPTRYKTDTINSTELGGLPGGSKSWSIINEYALEMTETDKRDRSNFTPQQIKLELEYIAGNLRCDKRIELKIGAQVMCVVNLDIEIGICNGSQGVVIDWGFDTKRNCDIPIVRFYNNVVRPITYYTWESEMISGIGVSQLPLILAWALTIHKAQGATLDIAEVDAGSSIFECGQTYVALSRVRSLEGLYLSGFNPSRILVNKKVQDFYDELSATTTAKATAKATATVVEAVEAVEVIMAEAVIY